MQILCRKNLLIVNVLQALNNGIGEKSAVEIPPTKIR
jgi:hypothetical protein